MKKIKKVLFTIIATIVMGCLGVSIVHASDGHFPDYASYWYNGSNSTTGDLYVLGDTSSTWTGITVGVNSFDSSTGVTYEVYNADTGQKYGPGNISGSYRGDYLWNISGKNQDVFKATSCRMYRIRFHVQGFPNASSGRIMVWTYKA